MNELKNIFNKNTIQKTQFESLRKKIFEADHLFRCSSRYLNLTLRECRINLQLICRPISKKFNKGIWGHATRIGGLFVMASRPDNYNIIVNKMTNRNVWLLDKDIKVSHYNKCVLVRDIDWITSHSTGKLFAKKSIKKKMKWNQYCLRAWLLCPRLSGRLWQMKVDEWKNTTPYSWVSFSFPLCSMTVLLFIYN